MQFSNIFSKIWYHFISHFTSLLMIRPNSVLFSYESYFNFNFLVFDLKKMSLFYFTFRHNTKSLFLLSFFKNFSIVNWNFIDASKYSISLCWWKNLQQRVIFPLMIFQWKYLSVYKPDLISYYRSTFGFRFQWKAICTNFFTSTFS
jgi:hypothetical protein